MAVTDIISGIALGLLVFIGIIMFVLGMLCGMRHMKRRQTLLTNIPNQLQVIEPVYEEVSQLNKPVKIEISRNVAYGGIRELS